MGRYRWRICALLFFATTINYIDRQVLGILAPHLSQLFAWSEQDYGLIVSSFQLAYGVGLSLSGSFLDRYGTRIGFSVAMAAWSIAGGFHALARSVMGFAMARFALGLGESANFPAAIKTVGEWFPAQERALATGIFNAGANVGAIVAPLAVPWIALHLGWEWAFMLTALIGLIWLGFWWPMYRSPQTHPHLSAAERAYIGVADTHPAGSPKIRLKTLLKHRAAWAIFLLRFVADPTWWFLLYWVPKFLNETQGLSLTELALPLIIIYGVADVGSIFGGWASSRLIARGMQPLAARQWAILGAACCVPPVVAVAYWESQWGVVALLSLAAAAHQAYAANMFTLISDLFPKEAVGRVAGFSGTVGAMGGALIAIGVGQVLHLTGSYEWVFWGCCFNYLIALGLFRWVLGNKPHMPAPAQAND